ncbi:MAG: hypothetical protein JNK26_01855 [Candidatus Doudnabacteria bacterium]|nr:hypothetical protein [Candidatus Doudnabacteria bacterium]
MNIVKKMVKALPSILNIFLTSTALALSVVSYVETTKRLSKYGESPLSDSPFSGDFFVISLLLMAIGINVLFIWGIWKDKISKNFSLIQSIILLGQFVYIVEQFKGEICTYQTIFAIPVVMALPSSILAVYLCLKKLNPLATRYARLLAVISSISLTLIALFFLFGNVFRVSISDMCGCTGDVYQGILVPRTDTGCSGG